MKAIKQSYPILPPKHKWEVVPDTFDEYICSRCGLFIKHSAVIGWHWRNSRNTLVSWKDKPPMPCNALSMDEALK